MLRIGYLFIIILLTSCSSNEGSEASYEGPYLGLSAFGATSPNFPCSEYLTLLEASPKPIMATLLGTFGDTLTCADTFASLPNPRALEIHLSNEAGRRNNRLLEGEPYPDLSVENYNFFLEFSCPSEILDRASLIVERYSKYLNLKLYISPGLEDNFTFLAYENLKECLLPILQDKATLIRNPVSNPSPLDEFHSRLPANTQAWSNDGIDPLLSDILRVPLLTTREEFLLLWLPSLQGFKEFPPIYFEHPVSTQSGFTPPRDREFIITLEGINLFNEFIEEAEIVYAQED